MNAVYYLIYNTAHKDRQQPYHFIMRAASKHPIIYYDQLVTTAFKKIVGVIRL